MNILLRFGLISPPVLPKSESNLSKNAQNAERDVNALINNLVRQGLEHYRTEDRDFPCEELANKALVLLGRDAFKNETVAKIQSYLEKRYIPAISYSDVELQTRIEHHLVRSYHTFNALTKRYDLIDGGKNTALRIEIEKQLKTQVSTNFRPRLF